MDMSQKLPLKTILILGCLSLQLFNGMGLFYSHPYLSKHILTFHDLSPKLLEISNQLEFVARIAGAYLLSKIADKYGFIFTMKFVSLAYFCIGILICLFSYVPLQKGIVILCVSHDLYAFFRTSTIVMSAIYLFRNCKELELYKYSALAWVAAFLGMSAINLGVVVFSNIQPFGWGIIYVINSAICFITYWYMSAIPEEPKEPKGSSQSFSAAFLAFLIAGVCGTVIIYQYYVVDNYIKNVIILNTSRHVIFSPFWISLAAMLLPAARIARCIGATNSIFISLIGVLFSAALLYIFPFFNYSALFAYKVIFGTFISLFIAPALAFTFQLLKENYSYFINFIFHLGFVSFGSIIYYARFIKIGTPPLQAASIITVLMLGCLLIIRSQKSIRDTLHNTIKN